MVGARSGKPTKPQRERLFFRTWPQPYLVSGPQPYLDSGEPHLLYGAGTNVIGVAISPDGRWVAASSEKGISLWPMPDLDESPLHTLPREALLAKLESLTNIRAVADEATPGGYRIEIDEAAWRGWREPVEW